MLIENQQAIYISFSSYVGDVIVWLMEKTWLISDGEEYLWRNAKKSAPPCLFLLNKADVGMVP